MAPAVELALTAMALIGHFSITVWLFNRLHALALRRRVIKVLEKILLLAMAGIALAFVLRWMALGSHLFDHRLWLIYAAFTWLAAAAVIPYWLIPKLCQSSTKALVADDTSVIDVTQRLGRRPVHGFEARLMASLPGNELLRIAVQRKTLHLPKLPRGLNGLTIVHLSDLHMTGQLGREFYDIVVEESNALQADLIVITGDILEKEMCLPWIEPTLGRLQARLGKYFIVGNHEQRLGDVAVLRQALATVGFVDLGGRCEVLALRGESVLIAGTELPWFGAAPDLNSEFASATPSSELRTPPFRLLLSHTPDQLPWARANGFELMLAGHNHGGQIRFPLVGALITPSLYGSRYAGGLYYEAPTLLHVSRGLAGIHPIRWNCLPEVAMLTLSTS